MGVKYKEMFSYAQRSSYFVGNIRIEKVFIKSKYRRKHIKGFNVIFNYFLDLASKNETTTTATLPQDANKVSSKFKFVSPLGL